MKTLRALLILCLAFTGACSSISYYGQSIAGQMELLRRQQPVSDVLADPAVDPGLKQKLIAIQAILDYARTQLFLPDNGSYEEYADINRQYVVWNVFAAPEFSLQPKLWCYPFIGCTGYRGYFDQRQALKYARTLQQAGWEVSVNGVSAYSTLGWLRDPLLNTMMDREDWEIARLLFHELAHQRIYVRDDTDFNEAFASAVAGIGLHGWAQQYAAGQETVIRVALEQEDRVFSLVLDTRDKYARLYQSGVSDQVMRQQKVSLHEQLQRDYARLKQQWDDDDRYDQWVRTGINNASLAALSAYRSLVPAVLAAFRFHGENLPRLYEWAEKLADCTKSERLDYLQHPDRPVVCPL